MRELLLFILSIAHLNAAITIDGLSSETVYTDEVDFRVVSEVGFSFSATLNGDPVPVGLFVHVDEARFYQLEVVKTDDLTAAQENVTIHFIVRAAERGSSENGIATWVPKALVDSAPSALSSGQLDLLAPAVFPVGRRLPIVALLRDGSGEALWLHGKLASPRFPNGRLQLRRGAGGVLLDPGVAAGAETLSGTWAGGSFSRAIRYEAEPTWIELSGTLAASANWGVNARVRLTGDFTIPAGMTVTVGEGSIVCVDANVDVTVDGELDIEGTIAAPCVVCPAVEGSAWGGFLLKGAASRLEARATFFTGSGADADWFDTHSGYSSHRDEQALFLLDDDSTCVLTDCHIIDNGGQVGNGSSGSSLTMTRCLVQRCQTAGQYNTGATVTIDRCHLIEFPVDDNVFNDADNDVLYLSGSTAVLTGTVLGWTKDDGIDAGGGGAGNVSATNCWVESCFHEGFALSGTNKLIAVTGTVVVNCGQAVECGYDGPLVTVRNSLLAGNLTGARYGDNYDWSYGGLLDVQDSLLLGNERDIFEWEWDTWTAHGSATPEVEVVNNKVTRLNPLHPANTLWDPAGDGALLNVHVPAVAGPAGVAVDGPWLRDLNEIGEPINLRLSEVRAMGAHLNYSVHGQGEGNAGETELTSGSLQIPAGLSELTFVPPSLDLSSYNFVRFTFEAQAAAEMTGRDTVYYASGVAPSSTQAFITANSVWRYHDLAQDLQTAWKEIGYNDSGWESGPGEFGFGEGDEATPVDGGPDGARTPTIYFRRTFQVAEASTFATLFLRLKRDDGAIVWINGDELTRENLPDTGVSYSTYTGNATGNENSFFESTYSANILRTGENTIAVELHQADAGSSDLSFDLELFGEPAVPGGLNLTPAGGRLVVWWLDGAAALEKSETLRMADWQTVPGGSPYEDALDAQRQFFRLAK